MKTRIIAAMDDIFFASKIRGTAEHLNLKVAFVREIDALLETARHELPGLIIVDLHARQLDALALARRLKTDERLRAVPLLGFFSHVQTELQQSAREAGFDYVLPRSAFTRRLPEILQGNL